MTATIFSLFGRACIRAPLLIALACLVPATAAQAKSLDGVDIAVEVFATTADVTVGVHIGPTEKELVKSLVRCAVDGAPVLDCARKELVKRLPEEVQPFGDCILKGQRIEKCASVQAISMLPPQLHGVANCIADGNNIAQCGKRFATDQLSQAKLAALNQVSATLDRLKTDAVGAHPLVKTPSSIQNIIGVAQGIQEGNAGKVVLHGSVPILQAGGRIILTAFLGPQLASLLGPASDALIQNRFDLVVNMAKAVEAGDVQRLGDLTTQAFLLNLPIAQACALLPEGVVRETACGLAAEAVAFAGSVAGAVVGVGAEATEDSYNAAADILTGNKDNCGTREQYYDAKFAFCKDHAVLARHLNPRRFAEIEKSLYKACRVHFEPCSQKIQITIPNPVPFLDDITIGSKSTEERISDICDPVRDRFRREVARSPAA